MLACNWLFKRYWRHRANNRPISVKQFRPNIDRRN